MHPAPAAGRHTGQAYRSTNATAAHQAMADQMLTGPTTEQRTINSIHPRFSTHNPVKLASRNTSQGAAQDSHAPDPHEIEVAALHEKAESVSAPWHSSCSSMISTPTAANSTSPSINSSLYPTSQISDFHAHYPQHFPHPSGSPSQDTPLSTGPSECLSTPQSTVTHSHTGFSTRHHVVRDWHSESCSSVDGASTEHRKLDLTTPGSTFSSAPDDSPWLRQPDSRLTVGSPKKIMFDEERQPQALRMQALKVRHIRCGPSFVVVDSICRRDHCLHLGYSKLSLFEHWTLVESDHYMHLR